MQFDTVLERTEAGITEINSKTNRLTQSERLVLIMIDGRTDIAMLIEKLPSLSMPRVFRAIDKLQELELLSAQLIAPIGTGNANDAIPSEAVERFLQQTDLDPATVIRSDPKDFNPTTLPHGVLLHDTNALRTDSELELRLKALMGETPRFARADTTSSVPIVNSEASRQAKAKSLPTSLPIQAEIKPEEVVRAVHERSASAAASTPKASANTQGSASKSSASATTKTKERVGQASTYQIPASLRPAAPPPEKTNIGLYVVMGLGLLLVLYTVVRLF
jgi:hypothetical protein